MLIMLAGVLVLVAVLAFGFYLHVRSLMANAPKPEPETVSTIKVQRLAWQPQLNAIGSLEAVRGVDVTTESGGLVRAVQIKSGTAVAAGTLLVQLNSDADLAELKALQAAAELSATTLRRDQEQLAAQAVSQATVDTDLADLKSKRAQVARQKALIAEKTVRAPFAGQLGVTSVDPGEYLDPGEKIVTLQTLDPIYTDFIVPQNDIASLAVGMDVSVTADAFLGNTFSGNISALDAKVDLNTRNVTVRATIANPQQRLLPGMFVRTTVDVGAKKQYLTLPQAAITYNPYGSTVFVVEPARQQVPADKAALAGKKQQADNSTPGGKDKQGDQAGSSSPAKPASGLVAQQVFVKTGETRGDQVAILQGLKEAQEVITSGQLKLKNGTPVVIDNSVQPPNNPHPTPQEQ